MSAFFEHIQVLSKNHLKEIKEVLEEWVSEGEGLKAAIAIGILPLQTARTCFAQLTGEAKQKLFIEIIQLPAYRLEEVEFVIAVFIKLVEKKRTKTEIPVVAEEKSVPARKRSYQFNQSY